MGIKCKQAFALGAHKVYKAREMPDLSGKQQGSPPFQE